MTLSFDHILVPYDGTKTGEKAFDGSLQLAKKFGSSITVLSCVEKKSTWGFFDTKSDKKDLEKRNIAIQGKISKMKDSADRLGIKFNYKVANCNVSSTCIVSYINSHSVDLIVMGKSSKISPEKIYHDSTVNFVYSHVNVPMLNI